MGGWEEAFYMWELEVISKRQLVTISLTRITIAQLRSHYSYNHDTVIVTNVLIRGAQNCPWLN